MILLISRKYPPSIGGMERLSYRLTTGIAQRRDARIIAWGGSQKFLPFFVVEAFVRSLVVGVVSGVDLIHLGDPALGTLGYVLGRILGAPVVVTVHGLDVIYPHWLYQWVTSRLLRRFAAVVAISRAARDECIRRGVRSDRCFVVTVGVDSPSIDLPPGAEARDRLSSVIATSISDRQVLLTTGRLVRRKGVAWFVEAVLPQVVECYPEAIYLVVGVGPEEARIRAAVEKSGLSDHVRLLGQVSEETLWDAYRACDLFVMPNVAVPGDLEGFGLVALEAGLAARYIVASDLEGIRDAVVPSRNGDLIPAGDSAAFGQTIVRRLADRTGLDRLGDVAQYFVTEKFGWTRAIDEYLKIFDNLGKDGSST